jgi:hypothetical protein
MSLFAIALFLHIVGALLLFAALTVEGFALTQGTTAAAFSRVLGGTSTLLILVPGFYLVFAGAGWSGWVVVGITGWVLIAIVGAVTGINVMRGRMGTRTAALSWFVRVGLAMGVVFVMTVKPDLLVSVIAVVIGAAAGFAAGAAAVRRVQPA